jgi:hypothetical protein
MRMHDVGGDVYATPQHVAWSPVPDGMTNDSLIRGGRFMWGGALGPHSSPWRASQGGPRREPWESLSTQDSKSPIRARQKPPCGSLFGCIPLVSYLMLL